MTALAKQDAREVARPLKVLAPLIKKDFDEAEKAGRPFEEAAGAKLIEAQEGHFDGDSAGFYKWAEKSFGKTRLTIRTCMAWSALGGAKSFKTQREVRLMPKSQGGLGFTKPVAREWTAPVDSIAKRARDEARRLQAEDELTRKQEREAEEKLGRRLIAIGYRVLAKELHPDSGGSREAMARLSRVRDRLLSNV